MPNSASCFTPFLQNINALSLPETFTFPFYYQPHPLTIAAATQLQQQLEPLAHLKAEKAGKMFGVLVVQNDKNELGFLSATRGKLKAIKAILTLCHRYQVCS